MALIPIILDAIAAMPPPKVSVVEIIEGVNSVTVAETSAEL